MLGVWLRQSRQGERSSISAVSHHRSRLEGVPAAVPRPILGNPPVSQAKPSTAELLGVTHVRTASENTASAPSAKLANASRDFPRIHFTIQPRQQ